MPNNTFKGNAGTEVVSDILILQKRPKRKPSVSDPSRSTSRELSAEWFSSRGRRRMMRLTDEACIQVVSIEYYRNRIV